MGWLIALGLLTLIAIIPIGVSALYDEDGPRVSVIAGPVRLSVFLLRRKRRRKRKKRQKSPRRVLPLEHRRKKKKRRRKAEASTISCLWLTLYWTFWQHSAEDFGSIIFS